MAFAQASNGSPWLHPKGPCTDESSLSIPQLPRDPSGIGATAEAFEHVLTARGGTPALKCPLSPMKSRLRKPISNMQTIYKMSSYITEFTLDTKTQQEFLHTKGDN